MISILNKLKADKFIICVITLLVAVFWIFGSLNSIASAQDKADLCSGANLSFDEGKTNCKTVDGTNSGKTCKNSAGRVVSCSEGKLNHLIGTIINVFSLVVGIVAVIMVIIGGFRYITSGGDSGRVTSAKNTLLYALVGLVIVALAQVAVKFVITKVR